MLKMPGFSNARLYVGNLPNDIREDELEDAFRKYGKIVDMRLKFPPRPPPFAFIEFSDARDAEDACRDMDGRDVFGERLRVEFSREKPRFNDRGGDRFDRGGDRFDRFNDRRGPRGGGRRSEEYRVLLSGLPERMSWQDIKDFMRKVGDVRHTDVDRRGNGTAAFSSREDVRRAVHELDNTDLEGQRIRVEPENPDDLEGGQDSNGSGDRRSRSPRRSRSRSPRRSRSHSPRRSRSRSPRASRDDAPSADAPRSESDSAPPAPPAEEAPRS